MAAITTTLMLGDLDQKRISELKEALGENTKRAVILYAIRELHKKFFDDALSIESSK